MKNFIWVIPVAVVLAFEVQTGSASAPQLPAEFGRVEQWSVVASDPNVAGLRVLSWNIDHGAHFDTIAAELRAARLDLLLLQEVDRNTTRTGNRDIARDLGRKLNTNGCFAVEFEELSQGRRDRAFIGQATLTRLPILRARVLRFRRQSGFWKPRSWLPSSLPLFQRRIGSRVALVTELKLNGRLLVVYNAHLESRSAGFIQQHQLDEILADAAQYPSGSTILIGGDLNTKYLPSIFLHKLEAAGFQSALGERIERTHRIAMALDWLFVKGQASFLDGAVEYAMRGSDHYPVRAILHDRSGRV